MIKDFTKMIPEHHQMIPSLLWSFYTITALPMLLMEMLFSQEVCLFSPCIKQFYEDKSSLAHTFLEFVFLLPACKLRY